MDASAFDDPNGRPVTAVTAAEMRAVDRVAVEAIGLDLCRMMEHAGRGLAEAVLDVRSSDGSDGHIAVLAGNGGNGGGGLACARHLANRDLPVRVVLDRDPASIDGVTAEQLRILEAMDVSIGSPDRDTDTDTALDGFVVDALIGYGLTGAPRGAAAGLIEAVDSAAETIVSLDVPSGTNATTGETPGVAVEPDRTVTLALPKTGLSAVGGDLRLVDLSIPATVYDRLDIEYDDPFGDGFAVSLSRTNVE
ncbi:NAD(P)H-hydrate epimerase [Halorubrum sp. E3]|uniref:NAD(P)H-hydrate epimerase n=1 Tax=Halorubrum sp. CGM4_25_10-8A TaxID=2518116 RepID=UPI000BCD13B2|nr:NAD(P)H-hydrate epimerase [Halorubrum sp. CGM4_25_10-8A]OYR53484.1 NAD(P)H-hydrate epimerase [Halorubrum sp. E3]OYR82778.1 NAD(P)H-hydrate epimerase [Halorubrum distributum]TKX37818.1 NAD(P)H-hydrate epimerase [Halorubrum sp. CGM4_25_10-8A]